jgi:hypothetical protein
MRELLKSELTRESEVKGKVLPVNSLKACRKNGSIPSLILNLSSGCREVVNIVSRRHYPSGRNQVLIEWEAGWVSELVWTFFLKNEKCLVYAGIRILGRTARNLAVVPSAG